MLEAAMARVKALELLETPDYCGRLKMEEFHNLLLRAGYSPALAQRAANQRGWDRLAAGVDL